MQGARFHGFYLVRSFKGGFKGDFWRVMGGLSLLIQDLRMADPAFEDAMIIIQEALAKIAKVSDKLSGLESNNEEVVAALKDLSNKVANLENGGCSSNQEKRAIHKAPLYIRVRYKVNLLSTISFNCIYRTLCVLSTRI